MKKFTWMAVMALMAMVSTKAYAETFDVALLDSETNTANFFQAVYGSTFCEDGVHLGRLEYRRYWTGWKYFLDNEEIRYKVLSDSELKPDTLAFYQFKVLILSNNYWLDDYQSKIVAEWVRRGGKLLATLGTGYQGVDGSFQKGGTNSLHQLWGDPSSKVYSISGPSVQITKGTGPTKAFAAGTNLGWMADANFMRERSADHRSVYGILNITGETSTPPAVIYSKYSKGAAVYLAVAPEFLVALAFDTAATADTAGHCPGDGNYGSQWDFNGGNAWFGYGSGNPYLLMKSVMNFLNP